MAFNRLERAQRETLLYQRPNHRPSFGKFVNANDRAARYVGERINKLTQNNPHNNIKKETSITNKGRTVRTVTYFNNKTQHKKSGIKFRLV